MATVLLLGANGFIGRHLLHALEAERHTVICGVRDPTSVAGRRCVAIDYAREHSVTDWLPRLAGVDVVINAVGILRETTAASFEALHVDAPRALFAACAQARVTKVIQISALGADEGAVSRYHLSKKRADDVLAALPLTWIIVQPSLVYGEGGTSARLFTTLAALPLVPLPGEGDQRVQPVHVNDLAAAMTRLIETSDFDRQRLPAVGPRQVTLRELLGALRHAMGLGKPRFVRVPMPLVRAAAAAGDKLRGVLLDRESLGMLVRGNVASPAAITALLGAPPRPVESFIAAHAATATATAARLVWLLPLLRAAIGIVWIVTGIVSLGVYPVQESYALLARVGLTGAAAAAALYGAGLLDLAFGLAVFVMRRRRWLWRAQMALIAAYSIVIAIWLPEFWLHPFGPILKNVPLLAAILMLHELEERR